MGRPQVGRRLAASQVEVEQRLRAGQMALQPAVGVDGQPRDGLRGEDVAGAQAGQSGDALRPVYPVDAQRFAQRVQTDDSDHMSGAERDDRFVFGRRFERPLAAAIRFDHHGVHVGQRGQAADRVRREALHLVSLSSRSAQRQHLSVALQRSRQLARQQRFAGVGDRDRARSATWRAQILVVVVSSVCRPLSASSLPSLNSRVDLPPAPVRAMQCGAVVSVSRSAARRFIRRIICQVAVVPKPLCL